MSEPVVLAVLDILQHPSLEYVELNHGSPLLLKLGSSIKHIAFRNTLQNHVPDPINDIVPTVGSTALESLLIQDFDDGLDLQTLVDWVLLSSSIDFSNLRRLHIEISSLEPDAHFQIQRILVSCSAILQDLLLDLSSEASAYNALVSVDTSS
ncbi:hypothetical protein B0H34DRAFT_802768 [Crassisporium funariophilum]|nr:hypothetical protein B0H34DRAFT_802768 [Crassisporium funariophilum]